MYAFLMKKCKFEHIHVYACFLRVACSIFDQACLTSDTRDVNRKGVSVKSCIFYLSIFNTALISGLHP